MESRDRRWVPPWAQTRFNTTEKFVLSYIGFIFLFVLVLRGLLGIT